MSERDEKVLELWRERIDLVKARINTNMQSPPSTRAGARIRFDVKIKNIDDEMATLGVWLT